MKRAEQILQIEKLKRDAGSNLRAALVASKKPVHTIRRHPALTMLVCGVAAGILTRRALLRPLAPSLKLLAIPLARQLLQHALASNAKKS